MDSAKYSAMDIAKYVVCFSNANNIPISNLKLQKILYFIQAEFLVNMGGPCFYEDIEAWDFGPVVPEVYQEYKQFGGSAIANPDCDFKSNQTTEIISEHIKCIEDMVNECNNFTATRLVEITHHQSPWKDAYTRYMNNIISVNSIKKYFIEG